MPGQSREHLLGAAGALDEVLPGGASEAVVREVPARGVALHEGVAQELSEQREVRRGEALVAKEGDEVVLSQPSRGAREEGDRLELGAPLGAHHVCRAGREGAEELPRAARQLLEGLAQDLGQGIPATGKVLLPRAEEGSPLLTQALTERGIPYEELAVYTTHYDNPRSPELREALEAGQLSYVTFTSASTVKGFVASVGEDAPLGNITGLCIGAQTAQEAQRHGIPVLVAEEATIPGLLRLAQTL